MDEVVKSGFLVCLIKMAYLIIFSFLALFLRLSSEMKKILALWFCFIRLTCLWLQVVRVILGDNCDYLIAIAVVLQASTIFLGISPSHHWACDNPFFDVL